MQFFFFSVKSVNLSFLRYYQLSQYCKPSMSSHNYTLLSVSLGVLGYGTDCS